MVKATKILKDLFGHHHHHHPVFLIIQLSIFFILNAASFHLCYGTFKSLQLSFTFNCSVQKWMEASQQGQTTVRINWITTSFALYLRQLLGLLNKTLVSFTMSIHIYLIIHYNSQTFPWVHCSVTTSLFSLWLFDYPLQFNPAFSELFIDSFCECIEKASAFSPPKLHFIL